MNTAPADFEAAERASAEGRLQDAIAIYERILAREPANPRALNALGNRLLRIGDPARARTMFDRAAAIDPGAPAIWLNVAVAARMAGDAAGELAALERALAIDPYLPAAILQKAHCHERLGQTEAAVDAYSALLSCTPPDAELPPAFRAALEHAGAVVQRHRDETERRVRERTDALGLRSGRFDYCMDLLAGRKKIYHPQPTGLHFPYLPPVAFFDRSDFPWFAELEAATEVIRDEFMAILEQDVGFRPYVTIRPGQPENQWKDLNHSLEWSAFFLWENGAPHAANLGRCPRTAALLSSLPLFDPPNAPTAMFSMLKPGAHIPPHTGVTNIRAVVHLPLVVPPGCGFRVGAETREWQVGKAWAFDDTMEHEAWNRSDEFRAILIVDAWNPYITEDERRLLRAATGAMRKLSGI